MIVRSHKGILPSFQNQFTFFSFLKKKRSKRIQAQTPNSFFVPRFFASPPEKLEFRTVRARPHTSQNANSCATNNLFIYKKLLLLLFICIGINLSAQKVAIYKTNDLLKRIYNNSDTLYIVNFWATWCKPCVDELPAFEKTHLASKIRSAGSVTTSATKVKVLLVLLVTMDFKEDLKKRVKPFLKKNNYQVEVILFDEINGNDFISKIAEQWSGAIPATIITQNNKQRFEFYEKKLSYEFLENVLNQH